MCVKETGCSKGDKSRVGKKRRRKQISTDMKLIRLNVEIPASAR